MKINELSERKVAINRNNKIIDGIIEMKGKST